MRDYHSQPIFIVIMALGGLEGGNEFYKQRKANTKMENEERNAAHLKPWGIYSRIVL